MGTKLDRKDVKIFANNSDATLITEFRTESEDGSTASFSRDPDVIQNANYEQGWVENQNNLNTKIFGEDMNAVNYVQSYLLKYLYENGIPEWSSTTEYFEHSIARVDNRLFISLTDNNINNDPTNTVGEWQEIPLSAINIITSGSGSSILNTSSGNDITLKSLSVDGYASLEDNGDQLNIHVIGGSGIVDAYWGQIRGTLTNQTDLVSALGDKQDNLTFDTPLSKDVNNEVSIPKATDSINGYLDATDFQTFAGKQDALSGFTHSYDTDTDTAQIYPTATNSNIGTSQYPIANVNASNVNANSITTTGAVTTGGDVVPSSSYSKNLGGSSSWWNKLYAGEIYTYGFTNSDFLGIDTPLLMPGRDNTTSLGGTYGGNGGSFKDISVHSTKTDKVVGLTTATTLETGASIVPDTDNTYDLGSSSSKYFANTYAKKTYTNTIDDAGAGKVTIDANTDINGSINISNQINMAKGQVFSWKDGGSAVAQFYTGGSGELTLNSNAHSLTTNCNINFDGLGRGIGFYNGTTSVASITSSGSSTINFNNTVGGVSIKSEGGNTLDTTNVNAGTIIKANGNNLVEFYNAHIKFYDKAIIFNSDDTVIVGTPTVGPKAYYSHLFSQISDVRGKEDIKDYEESVLNKIKGLFPITYKEKKSDGQRLGLSAQNLAEIEPLCVVGDAKKSDERLSIDLYSLATLSIKAIKELNEKVEELEARVKELEANKEVAEK